MPDDKELLRVKCCQEIHQDRLRLLPNVIGTATGLRQKRGKFTREVCVQVFVSRKYSLDSLPDDAIIPGELPDPHGARVAVDVIDAGFVQPLQDTTRYRPVPGGCSIGNLTRINAGTLGGWACDDADDTIVFLTNNHVVTATNNRQAIPIPSGVVQPGQLDGGVSPADLIGNTKRIIPIPTNPSAALAPVTAVDAAIGTITVDRDDDVLNIGPAIYELGAPVLNMNVQKRGRTTQFTSNGQVISVNASWTLNYGTVANPTFATIGVGNSVFNIASTDGSPFGDRGDSGSLIFDQNQGELEGTFPVVGLLFAGGSSAGGAFGTLIGACEINAVFNALDLTTVCTCYFRALIDAIFGGDDRSGARTDVTIRTRRLKEGQLRRFEDRILRKSAIGNLGAELLHAQIGKLSKAIFQDEEMFGLAIRTLDPWVRKRSNLDILEAEIDQETARNFALIAKRVAKVDPELKGMAEFLSEAVQSVQGKRVTDLLKVRVPAALERRPRPRARRGRARRT